jgi:hypothetical protein
MTGSLPTVFEDGRLSTLPLARNRSYARGVKLPGRKQISASEFANGARLKTGERFGYT